MPEPSYAPPSGDAIAVTLQAGYSPPLGDAIAVALPPPGVEPGGPVQLYATVAVPFQRGQRRDARPLDTGWRPTPRRERGARGAWQRGIGKDADGAAAWGLIPRADRSSASAWRRAEALLALDQRATWAGVPARDHAAGTHWAAASSRPDPRARASWVQVFPRDRDGAGAWNAAQRPAEWFTPEAGDPYSPPAGNAVSATLVPGYTPPALDALDFVLHNATGGLPRVVLRADPRPVGAPWGGLPTRDTGSRLPWGPQGRYSGRDPITGLPWVNTPPPPTPRPPVLQVHVVNNTVSVIRLPDGAPIEVSDLSLSANVDGWCWTVRMTLADPAHAELLVPDSSGPRLVQITLNSYVWTAIIEGRERSRVLGQQTVVVVGRSRTAVLDAPFAPRRSAEQPEARTARQLAETELALTGFELEWSGADWLVPGGAWYYSDLSPVGALSEIAAAAGAVLQSDPATASLSITPRYPIAPWAWNAAAEVDQVLPIHWVVDDSSQYASKPLYDAVFVRGEQQGVQARVTRQGSAGDVFADQVVHRLITEASVAAQRGMVAIADRGEQELVSLRIPLFVPGTDTGGASGLYLPLRLLEVQDVGGDWRGLSVGVDISARRTGDRNAGLEIWQTVSIERHLTDAG